MAKMLDMDLLVTLGAAAGAGISRALPLLSKAGIGGYESWRPGKKLKILLVGPSGAGNAGADARASAMAGQLVSVLGRDSVDLSVLARDVRSLQAYFDPRVRLVRLGRIFSGGVLKACSSHHMVVLSGEAALEGGSDSASALLFCEAAGVARSQGKPSIAYGVEAGSMAPAARAVASRLCGETYFIARTAPSMAVLREHGFEGHVGTDPAWTFPAAPGPWADDKLAEIGWDGRRPIVGAAVGDPFIRTVKPSLSRLAGTLLTGSLEDRSGNRCFPPSSSEKNKALETYVRAVAGALDHCAGKEGALVVLIGMDAGDLDALRRVQVLLRHPSEIFAAHQYDGYQLCAILRRLSLLITSDYHARVFSMPAGVPAAAVSPDGRLENLFEEMGQRGEFCFGAADRDLEDKLCSAVEALGLRREEISRDTRAVMTGYLEALGKMGLFLHRFVEEKFPGIPLPPAPGTWQDALGPVDPELERFLP
jgi:polysaccharide pyruvyl transferase WcaK-like protein